MIALRMGWVGLVVALAGCGSSVPKCTPGTSGSCFCPSGAAGAQTCNRNGEFDSCFCAATDAGSATDAGRPDAGTMSQVDAGQPCSQSQFWPDTDNDGFGSSLGPSVMACTAPVGFVGNSLDCADQDRRARPGQAEYQDQPIAGPRVVSPFDFNCDGREEARFGSQSGLCIGVRASGGTSLYDCTDGRTGVAGSGKSGVWSDVAPSCGQTGNWILSCGVRSSTFQCATLEQRTQGCR